MDVASSEFYNKETGKYDLAGEGRTGLTSAEMVDFKVSRATATCCKAKTANQRRRACK